MEENGMPRRCRITTAGDLGVTSNDTGIQGYNSISDYQALCQRHCACYGRFCPCIVWQDQIKEMSTTCSSMKRETGFVVKYRRAQNNTKKKQH